MRKREMNFGAMFAVCKPDAAAVRLDDRTTEVQPDAEAAALGRVEQLEGIARLLRVKAGPAVADDDFQLVFW
jgi:hypothetical protein